MTKPSRMGGSLPASCEEGELFLNLDAMPGQNLYLCTPQNQWTKAAYSVEAGDGIVAAGSVLGVDDTTVPSYVVGSGSPSSPCTAGRDYYVNSADGSLWYCRSANTWQAASKVGHTHAIGDVSGLQTALDAKQTAGAKGQADGYASLDGNALLPAAQLPAPTASTKGGVLATTCSSGHLSGLNVDGSGTCSADSGGGSSSMAFPNTRRWAYWAAPGSGAIVVIGDLENETSPTAAAGQIATATEPATRDVGTLTTQNSVAMFRGNSWAKADRNPRLQTYVQLPASTDYTGARAWIALSDGSPTATQFGSDAPATRYLGFRATAGSNANWQCQHANGTTAADQADSGVAVNTTGHKFEVSFNSSGSSVTYLIDGAAVCGSISTAHLPRASDLYGYLMGTMNTENPASVPKHMRVGWMYMGADK